VPILMLITWRGFYKKGFNEIGDEPQHWLWGDVTKLILESIGVKCFILDSVNQYETTKRAIEHSKTSRKPSALLLKRNESIYENR
jgi:sulfopyruvate decarboxylase TPP-binding subunit